MSYRILVADGEPASLNHILRIIEMKCPRFQVVDTAENGKEALRLMEEETPDLLITDIKMPVMDGLALVAKVKERYPWVLSVVVSGYQEFAYTKAAIKLGVCDYLLKPIKPSALERALNNLEERLNELYFQRRNKMIKDVCEGRNSNRKELKRYFPAGSYYACIVRKNGLLPRFSRSAGVEISWRRDEIIFLYGRDKMEALYLCPEELWVYKSFYQIAAEIVRKEKMTAGYVTAVIRETPFAIEDSALIFEELYRTLDEYLVIGEDQILILEELKDRKERAFHISPEEKEAFREAELLMAHQETEGVRRQIQKLFTFWRERRTSQMHVEFQVRYLMILLEKYHMLEESLRNCERIFEEAISCADDIEEISGLFTDHLICTSPEALTKRKLDTPEFFGKVREYIYAHLAEPVSIQELCREFGISQTYLSKLFRKYADCSFNKFLTLLRIEQAKKLMQHSSVQLVKDIAAKVGYSDQFYFSRIFTSVVGICPSDYMKQRQEEETAKQQVRQIPV